MRDGNKIQRFPLDDFRVFFKEGRGMERLRKSEWSLKRCGAGRRALQCFLFHSMQNPLLL